MVIKKDHFKIGDLVLIPSTGKTAVVTKEIHHKKFAGPVVRVLVDGKETFLTLATVKKIEVTNEN